MASKLNKLINELENDEDDSGSATGSGTSSFQPISLFDPHRETVALSEIRQIEARDFGEVDASTHSDLQRKELSQEEGLEMMQGPLSHPLLQHEAYFSGIDEIRNNPIYSNNTEAELRYKEQQLLYEKKLQLQKNLEKTKQFNPSPKPF